MKGRFKTGDVSHTGYGNRRFRQVKDFVVRRNKKICYEGTYHVRARARIIVHLAKIVREKNGMVSGIIIKPFLPFLKIQSKLFLIGKTFLAAGNG